MAFAKAVLRQSRPVLMPHNQEPVQLRIGVHTGPLVSGLVGAKMPKFTLLWVAEVGGGGQGLPLGGGAARGEPSALHGLRLAPPLQLPPAVAQRPLPGFALVWVAALVGVRGWGCFRLVWLAPRCSSGSGSGSPMRSLPPRCPGPIRPLPLTLPSPICSLCSGDTMNTASRMESTCKPGCVHVSEAFAKLLPHESWEPTGGVQVGEASARSAAAPHMSALQACCYLSGLLWRPCPVGVCGSVAHSQMVSRRPDTHGARGHTQPPAHAGQGQGRDADVHVGGARC